MYNYKLDVLFRMFLFGRKVTFKSRLQNTDQMLKTVMLVLLCEKSLSISDLADKIGTTVSTISEKISILEKEALIERTKIKDTRVTIIKITDAGTKFVTNFAKKMPVLDIDKKVNLTQKEAKLLLSLMDRIRI